VGKHLIGELLVNAKVITREQLEEALAQPRPPGKKIGHILLERGWISEAQLTQTLSLQLGVPWVSLYHIDFSRQLLNRVPREMAEKYCLIPIFVRHVKGQGETLYVATDDPKNEISLAEVARAAQLPTRPMIASPADIRSAIRVYYFDGEGMPPPPPPPPSSVAESAMPSTLRDRPPRPPPPPSVPAGASAAPPLPHAPPPPAMPTNAQGRPMTAPPPRSPSAPPPAMPQAAAVPGGSQPPPAGGSERPPARQSKPRMVALTLLDGTTLQLPARDGNRRNSIPPSAGGISEALTARDLISALRAVSHGADASEILGDQPQWEPVIAALLSVLLKKGVIADWEFIEEYRKI
jgi:type IV pilus assembly protein PilB